MLMMENRTREQLTQFLSSGGKFNVTVLTGDQNNPGYTSYAHYLTANYYDFIDGEGEVSDGIIFRNQTDDDINAEILFAVNNLHFLHQNDNLLIYAYPYLVVEIEDADPHPYVVIERI